MITESTTKNINLLALAKSFTDKVTDQLRDQATAGDYEIEAQVGIRGSLSIFPDYEQTQVNKVCPWTFLQVAWNKMPEHVRAACVREVQGVMDGSIPKPNLDELKVLTKAAVSRVKSDIKQTSRGMAKFNGTVFVVEAA
jgi:hypothetical protein